VLTNFYC